MRHLKDRLRSLLESVGFGNVRVTREAWPPYLVCYVRSGPGDADDKPRMADMVYLRIRTAQGEFGLMDAAGDLPMLDLQGTGVLAGDLFSELPDLPENLPFCPCLFEPRQLLRLWQRLTAQQSPARH